ncbi:unnamed protein product [Linum trigynum]|uniref:DUF223 domain-containing protein n=1 Tax=Linum trigynum TaxID=586398 RepID=A0AAV2CTK7_9ROSI
MEFTLLCNLGGPRNASVSLRLRLLHVWPAKSPGDIRIYNYCTLWVDETGMLIQGVSPTSMAAGIRRNLSVGKIYVIKTFALSNPPNQNRACSFDLALGLSPSASFQPCFLPAESFPLDAYEFVAFSQLNMRSSNHHYLTDVVGRLSSISWISHKIANNGPAVKQAVIVEDERFAEKHEVVESLPIEFATAADATADADRRTRTLSQLLALSRTNASLEEKYRCGGVIVDVESSTPWYYISCKLCSRAVSKRRDDTFWCSKDWQFDEEQTRVKLPLPGPTSFSSGEFRVTQVVPLDDLTVVGDLFEFSSPPPLAAPMVRASSTVGGPSGSSRASKGKEKVSDSLLIEAPAMPFSITDEPDLIDKFPSYEGKDFRNPISANVRNEDIDTESRVLGGSQVSVMGVQVGSTRTAAPAVMSSAVHSAVPSVQSAASMIPRRSARIE